MRLLLRLIFRLLLLSILLAPFALVALAWFGLEEQPRVLKGVILSHQDIQRARAILDRNDPRRLPAGARRQLTLTQPNVNLAANYLLQRYGGGATVQLENDRAAIDISARIPGLPLRPYLNISFEVFSDETGDPWFGALRVGQVAVPDPLARFLVRQLLDYAGQSRGADLAMTSVEQLHLRAQRLSVIYTWQPELLDAMREDLLAPGQQEAMAAYHQRLTRLQAGGQAQRGSVASLLQPMFAMARERSREHDPVVENRALLTVLGAWAGGRGMNRLLPPEARQTRLRRFRLSLQDRVDFGQHFLTSAALSANGDGGLSDAIGLYKEVSDSVKGSGFSFTDIAADRAGTRFGEVAVASEQSARRLQQALSAGVEGHQLMPPARDLPEHMNAAEFKRRFGDVGSPAYQRVMRDIESRLAGLSLYRD